MRRAWNLLIAAAFVTAVALGCGKKEKGAGGGEKAPARKPGKATDGKMTKEKAVEAARTFAQKLLAQDYKGAVAMCSDAVKKALPVDSLKTLFFTQAMQAGGLSKIIKVDHKVRDAFHITHVILGGISGEVGLRVVLDGSGKVAGLQIKAKPRKYDPPAYARKSAFTEKEVTVGTGKWATPGTLSIPNAKGKLPALVLVHGSGPQDRDESFGANRPFKDLAWGLASQGIVVLRYEKRTKQHGAKLVAEKLHLKMTAKEESVEDAVAAADLLRKQPEVDPKRVYVLGHSLGGYALPLIGQADSKLAGLIVLAGNARPVEDLIMDQNLYQATLVPSLDAKQKEALETLKKQFALAKSKKLSMSTPAKDLPMGTPPGYILWSRTYDPVATGRKLKMKMLVIQGGRDYQVTMKDFDLWKKGLKGKRNAAFKLYPDLHHLFMKGAGKTKLSVPGEYMIAGHVEKAVVDDIAAFIKAKK